jgi:hypothetical protein
VKKNHIIILFFSFIIIVLEVVNSAWLDPGISGLNDRFRDTQREKSIAERYYSQIDSDLYKIEDIHLKNNKESYSLRVQKVIIKPYLYLLGLSESQINEFLINLSEFYEQQTALDYTLDISEFLDDLQEKFSKIRNPDEINHLLTLADNVTYADLSSTKGEKIQNDFVVIKRKLKIELNERLAEKENRIIATEQKIGKYEKIKLLLSILTMISAVIITITSFRKEKA